MAGREGFEPPEACTSTVFKTAAFDHSAISRTDIEAICGGDTRIRTGDQGFAGPCLSHLAMSPFSLCRVLPIFIGSEIIAKKGLLVKPESGLEAKIEYHV